MYRNRKMGVLGIVITIIVLILLVVLSNINIDKFSYVESAAVKLVTPIQNGLVFLKNKIEGNSSFFTDLSNLKEENRRLKEENSNLEKSLRELEIIKAENATMKEDLNLKEKYADYQAVPAYIIDKDFSNYSNIMVINVGKSEGIEKNMTVIADKGLVGHVIAVDEHSSKVQPIIDPASTVSCTMSATSEAIVCKGTMDNTSTLRATYIPTDANIAQSDSVETSGMGGIYPRGIHVGTIQEVVNTQNITDRYAIVKTAVDFSSVQTVLVITN